MTGRSVLRHFSLVTWVLTTALVLGFVGVALGNSVGGAHLAGYSGQSGATCAACHNSGATAPAVSISGPSPVLAGQTNTYTISVSGGQAIAGGFGLSASAGTLVSTSADTTMAGTDLVQASSKAVNGSGTVSWSFDWTAPATPGTATLYASGNSVDGDGTFSGDRATETTLVVAVDPGANQAPVAVMNGPFVGVPLTGILFNGGLSSDDGSISDYQWDFGDGQTLSGFGSQVFYAYRSVGTYTVSLTVIDNLGASHSVTDTATITTGPPPSTTVPAPSTTVPSSTTTTPTATTTTGPSGVDGTALYGQFCTGCHGASGQGGAGPSVQISTASTSAIASWISNGVGTMPGFSGVMSAAEIDAVAVVTRGMQSATATTTTRAVSPPDSINAGVLYGQFCAGCHGGSGQGGSGPSVQVSTASTSAIASWIISGVGSMPGFAGTLSAPEINAIAALTRGMQSATATTTTTVPLDESATGAEIYASSCAGCHGAAGAGTANGSNLIETPLPASVVGLITAEGAGIMPGFAEQLTPEQIDLVAAHVGVLGGATPAVEDGVGADLAVPSAAAEALYLTNCAACHGVVGEGGSDGPLDRVLDHGELVELIATGPSTMPAYAKLLTDEEIDMIAGHVQSFLAAPTTEVVGSTLIQPAEPSQASEELGERLGRLGPIGAIDNRDGFPVWIAFVLTMVAGAAAFAWILQERISSKAASGGTEGKT